jgi:hypothetical protein
MAFQKDPYVVNPSQHVTVNQFNILNAFKGQCYEKVGEIRPWDVSLGSN